MVARLEGATIVGIEGRIVEVEVDVCPGLPVFDIVGLPDAALREAKERVKAALKNSGYDFPPRRITVNLAPAHLRKEGPGFDLPIALGILGATGQVSLAGVQGWSFAGELALDGGLRRINGVLSMAICVREHGMTGVVVPADNEAEARLVQGVAVTAADSIRAVVGWLERGSPRLAPGGAVARRAEGDGEGAEDMGDIKGHAQVKRSLEVAAAGGHNVLLVGPPGSGKTMLARRMPRILPRLSAAESLEVTRVYSVAGVLSRQGELMVRRPFRAPHHTVSAAALVGGGRHLRPGELSLAHCGVLFLDEMAEFRRDALEALRQPLEDGVVTVSRVEGTVSFPSRFMLVGATNPCPCGYLGDRVKGCSCTPTQVQRYLARLSGPLLDRMDIHVPVPRLEYAELDSEPAGSSSAEMRARVEKARERQRQRLRGRGIECNGQMGPRDVRELCRLESAARALLGCVFDKMGLTMRAHDRIIKVAQTIADLAEAEVITPAHVAEAVQYRTLDRRWRVERLEQPVPW